MTDRECLDQILRNLGMKQISSEGWPVLTSKEYYIEEIENQVFYCLGPSSEFRFNLEGNILDFE